MHDESEAANPSCSLFDDGEDEPEPAPKKLRGQKRGKTDEMITIRLSDNDAEYDLKLLSATHATSKLYVLLEEANLAYVLSALRNSEVGESILGRRDGTLPKGVWRRGDRFVVQTNSWAYVYCESAPDALAVLSGMQDGEHGAEEGGEADEP